MTGFGAAVGGDNVASSASSLFGVTEAGGSATAIGRRDGMRRTRPSAFGAATMVLLLVVVAGVSSATNRTRWRTGGGGAAAIAAINALANAMATQLRVIDRRG